MTWQILATWHSPAPHAHICALALTCHREISRRRLLSCARDETSYRPVPSWTACTSPGAIADGLAPCGVATAPPGRTADGLHIAWRSSPAPGAIADGLAPCGVATAPPGRTADIFRLDARCKSQAKAAWTCAALMAGKSCADVCHILPAER
jgi:hypothetical protein